MEDKLWLKSYPAHVPTDLEIENITLGEYLSRTANRFPSEIQSPRVQVKRFDLDKS